MCRDVSKTLVLLIPSAGVQNCIPKALEDLWDRVWSNLVAYCICSGFSYSYGACTIIIVASETAIQLNCIVKKTF